MKRFKFRFEVILRQRKAKEDQALFSLGEAQRFLQSEVAVKTSLSIVLQSGLLRREALGQAGMTYLGPTDFQMEQDFIIGTKQRIIQAEAAVARAKKSVEKCLRFFLLARRQSTIMENLQAKEFENFKKDQNKKEARQLDELITMRNFYKRESAEEERLGQSV